MSKNILTNCLNFLVLVSLFLPSMSWAADIDLQDLALPSDLKDLSKSSGAVFYSATTKNKTLMPVHIWGEVGKPGLHFIPVDTKLVKGLSFAGGGTGQAKLSNVIVNRVNDGKIKRYEFDLGEGGDIASHQYTLNAGDTIYIEKDKFSENRAYYTSLVAVIATILSSMLILKRLEER